MTLFPCWGQCNAYALLHIYFCTQTMHYAFKGNLIHLAWFKTYFIKLWADLGETSRSCSTISLVIDSLSQSVSQPFPPTALQCLHSQMVRNSSLCSRIDYVIGFRNFLNPKGHQNPISGSKVMAILLKMDLAYCWSCIGTGLCLQPAQQACFLRYKDNEYGPQNHERGKCLFSASEKR